MGKVNLCVLGCGSVARLHSRIARTLRSRVNLFYASRSLEKAERYNLKFNGSGAYGSYEEACASSRIDAVFICTPHAFHHEHVRLAAKYNKHILVEKPVARNLDELSQIETAVGEAGVTCMVAENYYFKPLVKVLQKQLASDNVGKPLFLELKCAKKSRPKHWRADEELMGGGALLEGGVHWINLICNLGGEVNEVLALRPRNENPLVAPFEDTLQLLIKFSSGVVGNMLHSWNLVNRTGGLQMSKIYCANGNIHFESNGLFVLVMGRRKRLYFPGLYDLMGYRGMLKHFLECVQNSLQPKMSLALARRDLAVVAGAYRSLDSNRFEKIIGLESEA
ncbi:MAG: Gfo/Idh/MocA family oxidoreductase [Candidatus Zixiibacteriota bacterium]|nr:MAG: Gfo/Idh/MocA family oxidoreductase [candidate division Zixibacteria bacterium]